jgi:hypothetical protein
MKVLQRHLLCFTKQHINPVKRYRSTSDYGAGGDRPPQDVGSRKLPDREQRCKHRHENAGACNPERNASDARWVQVASPLLLLLAVRHDRHPRYLPLHRFDPNCMFRRFRKRLPFNVPSRPH